MSEGNCCKCCSKPFNNTVHEYAGSTTIHGIAYIFEGGRLALERIVWVVLFVLALFLALTLSGQAYVSWVENPVLTSGKCTLYSVYAICMDDKKHY